LCSYFTANSIQAARQEIADFILEILQSQQQYMKDTIRTVNSIFNASPLLELCMMFLAPDFLNAPQFPNVWLIYRLFAKKVKSSGDEALIQSWADSQGCLEERLVSKGRLEAMRSEETLKVFATLFDVQ
jgi:hypothetical protein